MTNASALRTASILGFLAVALGAFGSHYIKDQLSRQGTTTVWEKAVFYQFIHSIMLVILATRSRVPAGPWWGFLIGIVLFSGSLYLLALTGVKWLGAITPFGGISFLVGWFWLVVAAARVNQNLPP